MTTIDSTRHAHESVATPRPLAAVHSVAGGTQTTIPVRPVGDLPAQTRRQTRQFTQADLMQVGGAMLSAIAVSLLLFGRLTPMNGQLGFIVTTFVVFVMFYAVLVSLTESRPAVTDRVMTVMLAGAAALALIALFSVVVFTLWKGHTALFHANFFRQDMSSAGPLHPLSSGGILHAVLGTLIMTMISLAITVPLGVATAV